MSREFEDYGSGTMGEEKELDNEPARSEIDGSRPKVLGVFYSKGRISLRIDNEHGSPLYYVDTPVRVSSGKPDVLIRADGQKHGQVLGVANYMAFSSNMKVGIGDPESNAGAEMVWEDLIKVSKVKLNYQFSIVLDEDEGRRSFIWRRTRHFGLEDAGNTAKWASTNFKLEDVKTGDIVANVAAVSARKWSKLGEFVIQPRYGKEWEIMVILTAMAIIQRVRRM